MSETAEVDQDKRAQKPNGVDKWNAAILTITMIAVIVYAYEACKQSGLMTQSVNEQVLSNGPLVYPNGVEAIGWTADKIPNKVQITFRNYGKSLALTMVTVGHIMMGDIDSPPTDPACNETGNLPKTTIVDAMEPDPKQSIVKEWVPAEGEDVSQAKYGRTLYVVGCSYYLGIDRIHRYFTDVCVYWAPSKPQDFQACNDPKRSYAH
jgi:hypothetical protein